ncbi:MAG: ATP-binding cassette domain-containing protein [Deltaproteobacteria bacterium]|nr:ATP-binding cassette domain-containing protein [Deltaproteobacteria bacterium]
MAIIKVNGLTKHYGPVTALNGISFEVNKGEIIGLLGPNGAGKTTTMKILTGYLQPSDGSAEVAGHDVVEEPLAVQSALGYLPENAPLYLDMMVQEYLGMMADLRHIPDAQRKHLLSEAIYSTGLERHLTKPIGELSKGYRQRVCLAQAILHQPQVLILDEPTNGLDPTQILEIRGLIKRLAESATIILSTHILSEVEATCGRAIIIMEGQIRADAKLAELTSTADAVVAINREAVEVEGALAKIEGVMKVEKAPDGNGYVRYRVTGAKDLDLCPRIYDLARQSNWRLSELRHESKTLESVFRDLAQKGGVA